MKVTKQIIKAAGPLVHSWVQIATTVISNKYRLQLAAVNHTFISEYNYKAKYVYKRLTKIFLLVMLRTFQSLMDHCLQLVLSICLCVLTVWIRIY